MQGSDEKAGKKFLIFPHLSLSAVMEFLFVIKYYISSGMGKVVVHMQTLISRVLFHDTVVHKPQPFLCQHLGSLLGQQSLGRGGGACGQDLSHDGRERQKEAGLGVSRDSKSLTCAVLSMGLHLQTLTKFIKNVNTVTT